MKESKISPSGSRRKFDKTFKRDAVELWTSTGRSAREIAAELGIREARLHAWKKLFANSPPATPVELEAEVAALRRENAQLRQQRDILKKTLGILSEAPSNGTAGSTQ
jgi:transposase